MEPSELYFEVFLWCLPSVLCGLIMVLIIVLRFNPIMYQTVGISLSLHMEWAEFKSKKERNQQRNWLKNNMWHNISYMRNGDLNLGLPHKVSLIK